MKWNTRVSASVLVLWVASASSGADWPQWRGPNRDGKSQETALMKRWPAQGPVQRWIYRGLGEGFGSVAVADGLVYVAGMTRGTGVLTAIGLDASNPRIRCRFSAASSRNTLALPQPR